MIKVLLVDDDFLVRTYLKQLIDWEREGFYLLGAAKDGHEALQLASAQAPDLIITDVCMPVMDGVGLIRELKASGHPAGIIVLSCHDDFAFVKEAMQLGADEYLMKNDLDANYLIEVLNKVGNQIFRRHNCGMTKKRIHQLAEIGLEKLGCDFVVSLSEGNPPEEKIKAMAKEAGVSSPLASYAFLILKIGDWKKRKEALNEGERVVFQRSFLQMCQTALEGARYPAKQFSYCFQLSEAEYVVLLDFSAEVSTARKHQTLHMTAENLCRFGERYFNLDLLEGSSTIQSGIALLPQAYHQAQEALQHRFYDEGPIFLFDALSPFTYQLPRPAEEFLLQADRQIIKGPVEELEQDFAGVLDLLRARRVYPGLVRKWLKAVNEQAGIEQPDQFYQAIEKITDIAQCHQPYWQKAAVLSENYREGTHPAVRQAIAFIQKNYTRPLSLQDAAVFVQLNPAYFSSLFKKDTGITFSEYLLQCRMNKVKRLLFTTSRRLKDIARQSGFYDYRHFCKLFKMLTGKTPRNYRQSMVKENNTATFH
ncbi:response regulator|uniref:Two-component response regulator, YesN/AraC family, consists of REC and AraC-type DNA-binding domains n=1 Tax=Dendrosporobacter quercicolus TaxID=146817 RepID=A0A1G9QL85_9FIRM|nr:response regulator [Dendrosporobacter quercicolus]NSL48284.1 response regulator [Dendrosporobacter quercicolus DSM 1736]SDM11768.1 Two-component response regulator, YesN/AraC family, consists of REC and AraC-type DNA-binding domains [Dendrosporobacter quercicolus]